MTGLPSLLSFVENLCSYLFFCHQKGTVLCLRRQLFHFGGPDSDQRSPEEKELNALLN